MENDDDTEECSLCEVCPVSRAGRHDSEPEDDRDEDDKTDGSHIHQDAKNRSLQDGIVRKKTVHGPFNGFRNHSTDELYANTRVTESSDRCRCCLSFTGGFEESDQIQVPRHVDRNGHGRHLGIVYRNLVETLVAWKMMDEVACLKDFDNYLPTRRIAVRGDQIRFHGDRRQEQEDQNRQKHEKDIHSLRKALLARGELGLSVADIARTAERSRMTLKTQNRYDQKPGGSNVDRHLSTLSLSVLVNLASVGITRL